MKLRASRPMLQFGLRVLFACLSLWVMPRVIAAEDAPTLQTAVDCSFMADHDGSQQKYLLLVPPELSSDQPIDVLIALHGHGSDRWQFAIQLRDECRATRDFAAAHGMLLVAPDYRAKTSWMGPAAEADVLQLVELLKKQYRVRRVILCGGSMGGTAALSFTARHPQLVNGVVALNGTANLEDFEGFQAEIARSFGGSKLEVPDQYRRRSAEFFPAQFTMPLAATTGGKDETVPPESVLRLLEAVRKHNSNVLSLHRPEGGHSTNYDDTKQVLEFVLSRADAR